MRKKNSREGAKARREKRDTGTVGRGDVGKPGAPASAPALRPSYSACPSCGSTEFVNDLRRLNGAECSECGRFYQRYINPPFETVIASDGEKYRRITDGEYTELSGKVWSAARELAFADQHLEQEDFAEAQHSLTTAISSLTAIQDAIDLRRVRA